VASKYEKIFHRLKPMPVEDMDYQAKANVVKEMILEHRSLTPTDDYLRQALVESSLEAIAEEVKTICELITQAPSGRRHASVFGRYWLLLRKVEDSIEEQLKNVRLLLYAVDQLGVEQFVAEGTDSMRFDELGYVRTAPEVVTKVLDRDRFRDWCMEAGLFRELNLHHGTTNSLTKARLIDGLPEPDGVQAFFNNKLHK
jgi:hypothetical protein